MRVRPIENNPEVLDDLAHRLGLSDDLGFHDVYSLDDPDLLAFVPRPALALIMILPTGGGYERRKVEQDADRQESDGVSVKNVVWYKQTIGNACGTVSVSSIAYASADTDSHRWPSSTLSATSKTGSIGRRSSTRYSSA